MKKLIVMILAVVLVCGIFVTGSFAEDNGTFQYTVKTDGTAEITGVVGRKLKDGNIPSELDGHKVTSIGWSAFNFCDVPAEITIPDTVTFLNNFAFGNCRKLKTVNIPDSLTEVAEGIFIGCQALTTINVSPDHPVFVVNNKMLINKQTMTVIQYLGQKAEPFEIIWGIKEIGTGAFEDSKLTSIVIPASVTKIGNYAFRSMKGLKEITIPEGVTSIGNQVFLGTGLSTIKFPSTLQEIGFGCFTNCKKLKSMEVDPANPFMEMQGSLLVDKQHSRLFFHLDQDKGTFEIPEGIEIIGGGAFIENRNLKEIILPESLKYIDSDAFQFCTGLTSINLPAGLKMISGYAFGGCSNLKSVTIPEGVTDISYYTFDGCRNLTEVIIPATVTNIESTAFSNCGNKLVIKAPAGSYAQTFCADNNIKFEELK